MKRASLLVAFALAACQTVPVASAGTIAGFGQVARINGLNVRPISLVEDSRCPIHVQCVWAGRVRILAEIGREQREMTLGEPVTIGDGRLTLVSVEPAKVAGASVDARSYRFTFQFKRQ